MKVISTDLQNSQEKSGNKCLICGDDIFVTNAEILQEGINLGAANSIIIKPNQIGTLI